MKLRISGVSTISVCLMLVYGLLPGAVQAQFSQQAKLVGTGYAAGPTPLQGISASVSSDGNTAIVGGSGNNNSAGAAWVFARAGDVWSQEAKLVGTDAVGPYPAQQGFSVAVSGDGNTVIVGGRADNNFIGAAWVFTRSNGVWTQEAKLVGAGVLGTFAEQGFSLCLSDNGNTAIVGGRDDNGFYGAAWVFTRSGAVWTQEAKLVGTGAVGVNPNQGWSVSLSGDGNTATVGGPVDNNGVGAAWVFTRSGGVWTQEAKLFGTDAVGAAGQGSSVSLSGDANTAIVGGRDDNGFYGAAWVFTRSGGVWSQEGPKLVGTGAMGLTEQGGLNSVSLSGDGNTAIVGGPLDNNGIGAAWVYAQPAFTGTPGKTNCYGQSVSALVRQFGGVNAAAAASGFSSAKALQNAILAFCGV